MCTTCWFWKFAWDVGFNVTHTQDFSADYVVSIEYTQPVLGVCVLLYFSTAAEPDLLIHLSFVCSEEILIVGADCLESEGFSLISKKCLVLNKFYVIKEKLRVLRVNNFIV